MKQYCVECDKFVDAIEKTYELTLPVKGEDITITATSPFCEECGTVILVDTIEENNIQLAYDVYREKHGLLKPDEIKGIRAHFHLSQHDFSVILGLGAHTLSRLERGDIISCALNTQIKSIQTKNDLIKLYEINKINLTDSECKRIEKAIGASDDAFDSFNKTVDAITREDVQRLIDSCASLRVAQRARNVIRQVLSSAENKGFVGLFL